MYKLLLLIITKAAGMNFRVQVLISLRLLPKSIMIECYNRNMFNLLGNYQTVF